MDHRARARHDLLSFALLASACSAAPLTPAHAPVAAAPVVAPAPAPKPLQGVPIDAHFADTLVALAPSALSRGHAVGRYTLCIYGNAAAASAWRAHSATYARGALLVAAHAETIDGAPGPVLVMQKRAPGYFPAGGDWRYWFADAALQPLRQGRLKDCATCHALATSDGVFVTRTAR